MFPMHLIGMLRMCGALTIPTGLNTNVLVNGVLASVVGDVNNHNGLGAILQMLNTRVLIGGIPAVPAIASGAVPDILGIIPHVQGFPIPIQGSPNVKIGQGNMAGALGQMGNIGIGSFGALSVGELVSFAGQVVGQVMSFTQIGGAGAVAQIGNLTSGVTVSPGQTLVGQTSGHTYTPVVWIDSRTDLNPSLDSVSANALVTDSGEYITLQSYVDYYPTQNLTAALVTL